MKDLSNDKAMAKLFEEAQAIAKGMSYDPYEQQGHFNNNMGPYEYCTVLATEIFVLNKEYDPRITLFYKKLTLEQVDWYNRFSDYEAILQHPKGEKGVRFDNALRSVRSISEVLNDLNKGYLSIGPDQLRKITPKNRKILLQEGAEVFDKLVQFKEIIDILMKNLRIIAENYNKKHKVKA